MYVNLSQESSKLWMKRGLPKTKMAKEARRGKVKPLWDVHGRGRDFQFSACKGVDFFGAA